MTTDRILRHRYYDPDVEKVVPKDAPNAVTIAAQALRDAADALFHGRAPKEITTCHHGVNHDDVILWLEERADVIEAGEQS